MRVASPTRVYLPQESSSTMIIERPVNVTCMTRHRPASAMYPVFDKPISQRELRVRLLVLPKRIVRRPIFLVRSRSRIVPDLGVGVRGLHELRQVLRGRHVTAGKPCAVLEARARHPEQLGFEVHRQHARVFSAWV